MKSQRSNLLRTLLKYHQISPNTSLKTPNIAAANASDSDTNTPSGTPNAVDTVNVAALPPDVRQMLEMIDDKKTISKETESIEVKELTRFIDDLELCRTRLAATTRRAGRRWVS